MRRYSAHTVCFMSFLLLLVTTGCSDPDKTGGSLGLTSPTINSVAPANSASGACVNTIVTATFSKAMNPATIGPTFASSGYFLSTSSSNHIDGRGR
jgi:hypothetical protein